MWSKKVKTSGKWKAKMVNTAFAWQFTWGFEFEGKCSIYYLCPWFNRGVHFFCTKLVKSKFGSNQIFRALFAASGSEGLHFCLVGQALYAARALLFSLLASVISSVWESNQSAALLVFLPKMEKVALLKFSQQSHALPLCVPGKDSSSAHANSSTLPCSRDLLMSKRGLPSFFVWYSYFDGNFALLHTKEGFVTHSALR